MPDLMQVNTLQYVMNTNGGATRNDFVEDHAPIGEKLWNDLVRNGWVREDDNLRIFLTETGLRALIAQS